MASYIVLLGPPGAGKGTQAEVLTEKLNLPHISSGDIFRENIRNNTELGKLAQTFIVKGELVPDGVTIAMIKDRFSRPDCERGAILDGFPRTVDQAVALDSLMSEINSHIRIVPYINAHDDQLLARLCGRWTCREHGHIFNEKYNPPRVPGICDIDQSPLYQRDDDKAETVLKRIKIYKEQTAPLIQFYRDRGVLVEINGSASIEEVSTFLLSQFIS